MQFKSTIIRIKSAPPQIAKTALLFRPDCLTPAVCLSLAFATEQTRRVPTIDIVQCEKRSNQLVNRIELIFPSLSWSAFVFAVAKLRLLAKRQPQVRVSLYTRLDSLD